MKPTDLNDDTTKNLNVRKDFQRIDSHLKPSGFYKLPKLFNETDAFVVDWQIPKSKISINIKD